MTVPEEFVGYTRHMIVRDPFARMVSIYGYLRRRGEMLAHVLGIAPWIERFLDQRRSFRPETYNAMAPSIWLATQAECWRQLRGDRFWKLEAIGDFLAAVNIRAELPRVNVGTPGEIPTECRERVWREWAREDCSMFGYARA